MKKRYWLGPTALAAVFLSTFMILYPALSMAQNSARTEIQQPPKATIQDLNEIMHVFRFINLRETEKATAKTIGALLKHKSATDVENAASRWKHPEFASPNAKSAPSRPAQFEPKAY